MLISSKSSAVFTSNVALASNISSVWSKAIAQLAMVESRSEESQSMSKNIRWSLQKRMAKGEMHHARVPYGYKASKKTGALVIDKKKQRSSAGYLICP